MNQSEKKLVFVLWAGRFEELAATTFITSLRSDGVCVKLVSLSHQKQAGKHGLILVPDMTLENALPLAKQAKAVIIPCDSVHLNQLAHDPRLVDFLQQVSANQAQVVLSDAVLASPPSLAWFASASTQLTSYPAGDGLLPFARHIAAAIFHPTP